ncbi:hypothetical protein MMC21_006375 [Puttea exsequens]|nr:hypothetical protein [Puttea exsequens]
MDVRHFPLAKSFSDDLLRTEIRLAFIRSKSNKNARNAIGLQWSWPATCALLPGKPEYIITLNADAYEPQADELGQVDHHEGSQYSFASFCSHQNGEKVQYELIPRPRKDPRRPDGRLVAEATLHLPPSVPSFMPALPLPALASSLSDRPRTSASTGSAPGLASKSSSRNRALSGLNHEEDETVDARLVTIQRRMQALHAETQRLLDETQTL